MQGYQLDFDHYSQRWQGATATVVEAPDSHVWGVVWMKNNSAIPSLDQ